MMLFKALVAIATAASLSPSAARAEERIASLNSPLSGKNCAAVSVEATTGASVMRCPGVGGFQLLVANDDERASLSLVDPTGREHPLDFWNVVTPSMSRLGKTAEWRVIQRGRSATPVALIVRMQSLDQSDLDHTRWVPLIAIIKITQQQICVTAAIEVSKWRTAKVRAEADNSTGKPCLTPPNEPS